MQVLKFKRKYVKSHNARKQKSNSNVEEVHQKWMDIPSATEMERGRASEMEKRKISYKM